jgi:RNA polymerase subunit RPABC4/transcription elongation factor Spt4
VRFALDGLPRNLRLSRQERRQLRAKVRAWCPPRQTAVIWIAVLIPPAIFLLFIPLWLPPLWLLRTPWKWPIISAIGLVQFWLTLHLVRTVLWPHTCRALAAVGHEVCPRCAAPQQAIPAAAPATTRICPQCGAERLRWW